ncbi:hypothetical protein RclHR1_14850002 [Rhizophagus clarus]|uniref:Uncharacterized protein n=1 Tax=Rhizophagus clarus TaxID=94130 RepID=A0A2Z6QDM2_9GLOM|nr:hypothetical protein RclHR1_14850002 [Rhizophagus clarus]
MIELLNPNPQKQQLLEEANTIWKEVKKNNVNEIKDSITRYLATPVLLTRYGFQVSNFRNSRLFRPPIQERVQIRLEHDEKIQIPRNAQVILQQNKRLTYLKWYAATQERLQEQKQLLLEENIIEKYDLPGRPSHALKNPELYDQLHACIEFGLADNWRRKEWIKVHTISHF